MENKMLNDILDSIIKNANESEIELIRVKLNDYLINHQYESNAEKELSKSVDGSFCPFCGKNHIIKHGKDSKGHQRYRCKECHKTFSTVTHSLLSYTKKLPSQWHNYICALFSGMTIKQCALAADICEYTSLVWRHKILSICANMTDISPVLDGIVYLDEKLVEVNHPGQTVKEPVVKKRGISNHKRNICCAIDEHNKTVIEVSETGRIHSDALISVFKDYIPSSCTVVSDSLRSYHQLMDELKVNWIKIPSGKKERDGYTLDKINNLHSAIELFLHKYRGISDKYLRNYIGLFKLSRNHKDKLHLNSTISKIFLPICCSSCELKFEDFSSSFKFSMLSS